MSRILFCGGATGRESRGDGGLTTSFVVVSADGKSAIIFDLGSGVTVCSKWLKAKGVEKILVALTHYHWDHKLGDQNCHVFFRSGDHLMLLPILSDKSEENQGRYFRETLTDEENWPVSPEMCKGKIVTKFFKPGEILVTDMGDLKTILMPHAKFGAVTYRLGGLVFATDLELSDPQEQRRFARFADGCDTLVIDIQYRQEEYDGFKAIGSVEPIRRHGWGHNTPEMVEDVLQVMNKKPRQLIVTHHDPDRTPEDLDDFTEEIENALGGLTDVICAKSGEHYVIRVPEHAGAV